MNDAVKLLPCPFCGGEAVKYGQRGFVGCGNMRCDAFGISFSDTVTWNTRATDPKVQVLQLALAEAVKAIGLGSQRIFCHLQTPENKDVCQSIRDELHAALETIAKVKG